MSVSKVLADIYSVGVVDWNVRNFHGHTYTTQRGSAIHDEVIDLPRSRRRVPEDVEHPGPYTDDRVHHRHQLPDLPLPDFVRGCRHQPGGQIAEKPGEYQQGSRTGRY